MSFHRVALSFFRSLTDETKREYENAITKFAEQHCEDVHIKTFEKLMCKNNKYSFPAFFCLCTIYRRNKDFEKLNKIIFQHTNFQSHISYNHILVMYLVHSESIYDYDNLLELAFKGAETLSENSGYLNTFANAFATICEKCNKEDCLTIVDIWYERALKAIESAIALEPKYAKFYCTKARIISLRGRFEEAISLILHAISIENSSRPDYALTIMNYQYYRLSILMRQQASEFEKQTDGNSLNAKQQKITQTDKDYPKPYTGNDRFSFVSYSHDDAIDVYKYINLLQKNKINVWYDKGILPGEHWNETLGERIINSSVVVVFLTNSSINSANVRREINMALLHKKPIVVVMLENVILSPGIQLQFALGQIIKKEELNEFDFLTQTVEGIKKAGHLK